MNWSLADGAREFNGNSDRETKVKNEFLYPFRARTIRICPTEWQTYVSMRFEAYFLDEADSG